MDLVLNNPRRLICHSTTKQTTLILLLFLLLLSFLLSFLYQVQTITATARVLANLMATSWKKKRTNQTTKHIFLQETPATDSHSPFNNTLESYQWTPKQSLFLLIHQSFNINHELVTPKLSFSKKCLRRNYPHYPSRVTMYNFSYDSNIVQLKLYILW